MHEFRANIAILTNITPDHLDRYNYKVDNYIQSKFRIVRNQTAEDVFIYSLDDILTQSNVAYHPTKAKQYTFSIDKVMEQGGWVDEENIYIKINNQGMKVAKMSKLVQLHSLLPNFCH